MRNKQKERLFSLGLAIIFAVSTTVPCYFTRETTDTDMKFVPTLATKVEETINDPLSELKAPVHIVYERMIKEDDILEEPEIQEPTYKDFVVPFNFGFKSYMGYKCITSKSSPQYVLQHERAYTGDYGIRQVDGRFCAAIGSYYTTEIGTLFDLILENGTIIPCILADQKADKDTCSKNIVTEHNGCLSEFVVDMQELNSKAKQMGDISYCNDDWNSPVAVIRIYN